MTERIKLTEDDIHVNVDQFFNDVFYVEFRSLEGEKIEWTKQEAQQLKQQILEDHEKIELLTKSELRDLPLLKVAGEQTLEIKQLKELIELKEEAFKLAAETAQIFKDKLKKIKEAWHNREFSAEGDDFDDKLKEILKQ